MKIVTSAQMKRIEQHANEAGLSYRDMMENAGAAAARSILRKLSPRGKRILVYAGKGNNGGDGFVAARYLHRSGARVKLVLVEGEPKSGEARDSLALAREIGLEILTPESDGEKLEAFLRDVDVIVDALYGTGFHGSLHEQARAATRAINTAVAAVFSLDLPSGVDADAAEADEDAVQADFTIAFDSLKPAHFIYPGAGHCGTVSCADIGIDAACRAGLQLEPEFTHITDGLVFAAIPRRPQHSHKGAFGRLLNLSSSLGMAGAGQLSTLGALRVGTGLVTLACPRSLAPVHAAALKECTLLPLPETPLGSVSAECIAALDEKTPSFHAVIAGCGLSCHADTTAVIEHLLQTVKCPLVLDADGINALCGNIHVLDEAVSPVVLTPHPAEMARMLGIPTAELLSKKVKLCRSFAQQHRVTLVLKGSDTLVFTAAGRIFVNTTGNSGLAKGGSGDVLTGMIGGLIAQGLPPEDAAVCGVFLHGAAGDRCAQRLSETGMLPSDLLDDLCALFLEYGR